MKKAIALILALVFLLGCLSGCGSTSPLNPKEPVTLTMWHNYGGDMQQAMDYLIDQFNSTVGKEQGIVIDVTAISSSSELDKSLTMIVNGDPGAPDMPDIFTGYPKLAILFQEKGLLANLDNYFTEDELSAYVEAFVEEGRLSDGNSILQKKKPTMTSTTMLAERSNTVERLPDCTYIPMAPPMRDSSGLLRS